MTPLNFSQSQAVTHSYKTHVKCRICPATQHSCYTLFFFSDWKIQAPDGKLISDREQERGEGDEEQTGGRTGWTSLNFIKVPCSQSLYILHCFLSLFRTYQMRYWVYHYRLKKVHPDCTHVNYLLRVSDQTSERSKGLLDYSLHSLYSHNVFAFVVEKLWMKECGLCQLGFLSHRIYRYIVIQLLRVTALDNRGVAPC